jgi:hypothetical protein
LRISGRKGEQTVRKNVGRKVDLGDRRGKIGNKQLGSVGIIEELRIYRKLRNRDFGKTRGF